MGVTLALTTIAFFAWSMGEFSSFAPASLASHLPLFSSFRIPSRFTIAFVLSAALTVAWAARALSLDAASSRSVRVLIALVCIVASMELIARNRTLLANVFSQPPLTAGFKPLGGPRELRATTESNAYREGSPMLTALMNDLTFPACYESLQLTRTADFERPLVFSSGTAQVSDVTFTPNRVEFSAMGGDQPSLVSMNQNYSRGWRSTAGPFTKEQPAMPGVTIAPGQSGRFAFVFVPEGLWAGTAIFVFAAAVSVFLWRRSPEA